MFRKLLHGFLTIIILSNYNAAAQIPIGQWREHSNYQHAIQVLKGNQIYCATKTNVFAIDDQGVTTRFSKTNGLNDVGVSCIGWDDLTQQLVIAYENSNLDIIRGSIVKNIADIQLSNVSGNKRINHIYCKNGIAYLCSGIGIISVDLRRYEIKDTWIIGNNGNQTGVNAISSDNNFFYAATDEGLKTTAVNSGNPSNFSSWTNTSGTGGLTKGAVAFTGLMNGRLIAVKTDSVFGYTNNWSLFYHDPSWQIIQSSISDNKLHLAQKNNTGGARLIVLSATGSIEKIISQAGVISYPRGAVSVANAVWIADQYGGLSKYNGSIERFIPNGPAGISSGEFAFSNGAVFTAAGSINKAWNYLYNRDGIFQFKEGNWTNRGAFNTPVLDSVLDFITIAADPRNGAVWAGSYGGGLIQFSETGTTVFKQRNSPLQAAIGDPNSYRISGLAFDTEQNLWISNYGAPQALKVLKANGTWTSFTIPYSLAENATGQLITDEFRQLWIVSPKNNGLLCYQYGQSIDNTSDDRWKFYRQGSGNGNLPSSNVLAIAKDKSGSIWVGTDDGIGIIDCVNDVFASNGCDAVIPVLQQDQFAGYLFKGEQVQSIAVDGANQKWIGTQNGAWLLSKDGRKIIQHFTAANSPLLSNDVKKIGVDPTTGEVFFATFNGICSYRSTSTEASSTFENILVFPNPVPPSYSGTIAIKGLSENSIVKITELNGRLVFQTRSLGGQAIWNGRNYNGHKTASGVYLVFVQNDNGTEKLATKIIIISGR